MNAMGGKGSGRPADPKREWHILNTHGRILASKPSPENKAARRGMAARQRQIIAEQQKKNGGKK